MKAKRLLPLLACSLFLGCSNTNTVSLVSVPALSKADWMREATQEEPLPSSESVIHLETPFQPQNLYLSPRSRYGLWSSSGGKVDWASELERIPLPASLGLPMDWSQDGSKILFAHYQPDGLTDWQIVPLGDGPTIPVGPTKNAFGCKMLPDASGISFFTLLDERDPLAAPSMAVPKRLYTKAPGQAACEEIEVGAPGDGVWSPDAQRFAYLETRNRDSLQGLDLKLYDRQSRTVFLLHHIESDKIALITKNLSWDEEDSLVFTLLFQDGPSSSISITRLFTDGRPAVVTSLPLPLEAGAQFNQVLLSPDRRFVAYDVLKPTAHRSGSLSGTVLRSQGIYLAALSDGSKKQLAPRGTLLAWRPDSKEIVCSTGYPRESCYYRIVVGSEDKE